MNDHKLILIFIE